MRIKAKRVTINGFTYVESETQAAARAAGYAKKQTKQRYKYHLSGKRWLENLETFKVKEE